MAGILGMPANFACMVRVLQQQMNRDGTAAQRRDEFRRGRKPPFAAEYFHEPRQRRNSRGPAARFFVARGSGAALRLMSFCEAQRRLPPPPNPIPRLRRCCLGCSSITPPTATYSGFRITPRLSFPFISTVIGASKRRCRTQPSSSTSGCSPSHVQSTKPSPASGFTVKYPI